MHFQTVSTAQKLPTSRTQRDLSATAKGGYLADGATPGPVLRNALDFVYRSLGRMVSALAQRGLIDRTAFIVSAFRLGPASPRRRCFDFRRSASAKVDGKNYK